MKVKYLTTPMLIELNEECINNPHCSRALDEAVYEKLDPDGFHMLLEESLMARFGNTGFRRMTCYLKFIDQEKPHIGPYMDITDEQMKSLPSYTNSLDERLKTAKECSECGVVFPHAEGDYQCLTCRGEELEIVYDGKYIPKSVE